MFTRIKLAVACAVSAVAVTATSALAGLAPADEALITAGLSASDATFYKIGGAVLVVLAGIWGFKKVVGLVRS